ncbi:hypothetical protein IMSHALPRED_004332 [Imshaugia aleurites]|uniref:Uncharacterized protein n=1 Tax=Imshaugia aleurites TaxID=172621 RepID=A0A8H3IK79_9LECA|nr:hypothetical protein IMSHALPRED_004332 [Imshaugia aleurites]
MALTALLTFFTAKILSLYQRRRRRRRVPVAGVVELVLIGPVSRDISTSAADQGAGNADADADADGLRGRDVEDGVASKGARRNGDDVDDDNDNDINDGDRVHGQGQTNSDATFPARSARAYMYRTGERLDRISADGGVQRG